jgi:hypothetical protein
MQDARDRNRYARGSEVPRAKLTEQDVREILSSDDSIEALAARYEVSPELVGMIQRGLRWKHVVVDNLPERVRDRRMHGRYGRGHWRSVLTEDDVRAIRSSSEAPATIAVKFGTSRTNIYNIRRRKTWTHVT